MYYVMECHGGPFHAFFVVDEDGKPMEFKFLKDAMIYAANNCQIGVVMEVDSLGRIVNV